MNRTILRILDILIIVSFFVLLYILIEPQYQNAKITTKKRKLQSNMFVVKAAIERYRAFHSGVIPSRIEDIYENMKTFGIPTNPYTNQNLSLSDFNKFTYISISQIEEVDTNSFHAEQRGKPGGIGIGFYFPPVQTDSLPLGYGIIGFDSEGKPLTIKEGEKVRVFVLTE
ncbi:MAG: hypothetical protein ABIN61_04775 [candidate division WOR-3 bacterium]